MPEKKTTFLFYFFRESNEINLIVQEILKIVLGIHSSKVELILTIYPIPKGINCNIILHE